MAVSKKFCVIHEKRVFEFYINDNGNIFFQDISDKDDFTQSWGVIPKDDWSDLKKFIDNQLKA